MINVAVNGYGTIGKRVADAVLKQDDMKLVGVAKTKPDFSAKYATGRKIRLYSALPEKAGDFSKAGIDIAGNAADLFKAADVVVDCTPGKDPKVSEAYKNQYKVLGKKGIWEGGEAHELAGFSFNAFWSYDQAKGRQFARVVSCNTTGLCRSLWSVSQVTPIERVDAVMVRRAADPGDSKNGPINAIKPVVKVPSHHGPDVRTVIPNLNINTMAVAVPTTLMHVHCVTAKLKDRGVKADDIISSFEKNPRLVLVDEASGFKSTAEIMEYARDLGRPFGDLYEIAIWRDSVSVVDGSLYFYQAIHQESDVIPDNIDCIRAMFGKVGKEESMKKTNKSLGIK